MHPRLYRLIEVHQRIDRTLRDEQQRRAPNLVQLLTLARSKDRAKALIRRFALRAARI